MLEKLAIIMWNLVLIAIAVPGQEKVDYTSERIRTLGVGLITPELNNE